MDGFFGLGQIGLLSKCDSDEPKHYLDDKQEASNLKEDNKFLQAFAVL